MKLFIALLAVLVVVLGVLELIPANSYVLLPGDAVAVAPLITVQGHAPKPHDGPLYLTDVSFYKANHLLEELYGRLNPDADIQPAQQVSGGLSQNQYLKLNAQMMVDSTQQAKVAAFGAVRGYHPTYSRAGPKILFVYPNTPASKVLKTGDVLQSVDGHRTHRAKQVAPLVKAVKPGAAVTLGVLRKHAHKVIRVKTIRANASGRPDKNGKRTLIGIYVKDQVVFPFQVKIKPGKIVGPSAGFMFALEIVQQLERRDIAKGCPIAGTGTIDENGNVGEIGGAKQKIIAARHAGVKYFLVPTAPDNLNPARQNRGDVKVVPVKTLKGALKFLQGIKPCR